MVKRAKIKKWVCECGNTVISEVKETQNGKKYTEYYCSECQKRNPLNAILVQEVSDNKDGNWDEKLSEN